MQSIPTIVEVEIQRAEKMVRRDHRQRWVTLDGIIHVDPVPFRDAVSIRWLPIHRTTSVAYRDRVLAHPAY